MVQPGRNLVLVQACLNGSRRPEEHLALPVTADELTDAAYDAVEAGAAALHVHPRGEDGETTLDPDECAEVLTEIRRACPFVPVGLTTIASAAANPEERLRLIRSWTVLPDFASVNLDEEGAEDLCRVLLGMGIGVEAGLSTMQDAHALIRSELANQCLRILVEPDAEDGEAAVATASAIDHELDHAGASAWRLHHGYGMATWAVLRRALQSGHDIRVGLEDTLQRPDGEEARDNAELVRYAVDLARRYGREPVPTEW